MSHARAAPRRPLGWLTYVAGALAVLVVSGVSLGGMAAARVTASFQPSVQLTHAAGIPSAPAPTATAIGVQAITGSFDFLLTGDDSGGGNVKYGKRDERLNDVTMLMHVYADHRHAVVLSFPRDLHVTIPACGAYSRSENKINVSYAYGGLACTAATVEQLTGLRVDYAADVDFDGASAISTAIGGVQVCIASPIDDSYSRAHLPAGNVTLKGDDAIAFLRSRHGVGDGSDLGRVSDQQLFFSAAVRQLRGDLGNLPLLYEIAQAVAKNVTPSSNLTELSTLVALALALKDIAPADISFVQYPNHYVSGSGDVWPDTDSATELVAALKADRPIALTGKTSPSGATEDAGGPSSSPPIPLPSGAPSTTAVALPSDVTGQTAAQQTCTRGN